MNNGCTTDKKTVIKDLIELGKSKGQLSTKEILDALGELDFDPEHIEKFYDTLESQGVEIVEDFDDIQIDDVDLAKVEGVETLEPGIGADGVSIDDPVKVYLKEIGRVPLLTRKRKSTWLLPLPTETRRRRNDFLKRTCGWW